MGMFKKVSILASSISLSCLAVAGLFSSLGTGAVETKAAVGTDTLTYTSMGLSASYTGRTYTGDSGATYSSNVYGANASGVYYIQMSNDSNRCLATTVSGGYLESISFQARNTSKSSRSIYIRGSHSPYASYADNANGELLDTFPISTQNTLTPHTYEFEENWEYFSISVSGAIQFLSIDVTWTETSFSSFGTLERIELTDWPNKLEYYQNETFDWTGLTVTAYDTDGKTKVLSHLSDGLTITPSHGSVASDLVSSGIASISYTEGDVTCNIEEAFLYEVVELNQTSFEKVTDASTLMLGDRIVIASSGGYMGSVNGNHFLRVATENDPTESAALTFTDAQLRDSVNAVSLELGYVDGTYAFNDGDGLYLTATNSGASSGSNYMYSYARADEDGTANDNAKNASWSISVTSAGVATVSCSTTGNKTRYMSYNSTAPNERFSSYLSEQSDIYFYRVAGTAEEQINAWANYVMAWDDNNQCVKHYWTAKLAFLNKIGTEAQELFKATVGNSDTSATLLEKAKARYEAWATNQGDTAHMYDGTTTSGSVGAAFNSEDVTLYAAVAAVVGLSALATGFFLVSRRKRA